MEHGLVDVFAFQEALLIEAIFGIVLLAMLWAGFRRWLQYKEKMGRPIAEQLERVEARLQSLEQIVSDGGVETAAQISALHASPLADLKRDEA